MILKRETDLETSKKEQAISEFTKRFKGRYSKIGPNDVDFKIIDSKGKMIGYAEIIISSRVVSQSYPVTVNVELLSKLISKRLNPVLIWACEDGYIYGRPNLIVGKTVWSENELLIFYNKQKNLKYFKY